MNYLLTKIPLLNFIDQNQYLTSILLAFFIFILVSLYIKKQEYPYQLKQNYLSSAELLFMNLLEKAFHDMYNIVPQVPLKSIIQIKQNVRNFYRYFNKIDRKIVDFVFFDKKSYKPLLVIELDDSSHNSINRKNRDLFIDKILKKLNLPILHIPAKYSYDKERLIQEINYRMGQYKTLPGIDENSFSKMPKMLRE